MKVDIVIAACKACDVIVECIDSVLKNTDLTKNTLLLINDNLLDSSLVSLFERIKSNNKGLNIVVLNNETSIGFSGAVNRGMMYSDNDVLLLNAGTIVTSRWLEKIQDCAYKKGGIATVSPLANNIMTCSMSSFLEKDVLLENGSFDEYANIVERCSLDLSSEIPVACGSCMYIRKEAINVVGYFDEKTFGNRIGAVYDFCYRCTQLGYRHLLCDNTFVYEKKLLLLHGDKEKLSDEDLQILKEKYSESIADVSMFCQNDIVKIICENVKFSVDIHRRPNVLMIVHTYQDPPIGNVGGTSIHVYDLSKRLSAYYNIHVLYYNDVDNKYKLVSYVNGTKTTTDLETREKHAAQRLYCDSFQKLIDNIIALFNIKLIHIHHLKDMYLDMFYVAEARGIPVVYSAHDYFALCPNFNLLDADNKSCHQNDGRNCLKCVERKNGQAGEHVLVWQNEFHRCLKHTQLVVAPSNSVREIFLSFYRDLNIKIIEHGCNGCNACGASIEKVGNDKGKFNIAFIGGISEIKGLRYLEELIDLVANTDVCIHLIGETKKAKYRVSRKNYIYHGQYDRNDLPRLLRQNNIHLACLLSIVAETFSYVLSETLLAGIPVITFDIGATAERTRKIDAGWIMPLGCTTNDLFNKILQIKVDTQGYQQKVDNIVKYQKHAKSVEYMADEYKMHYSRLLKLYPVDVPASEGIGKIVYFMTSRRRFLFTSIPNLVEAFDIFKSGDDSADVYNQYHSLKNIVVKGGVSFKVAYAEVKSFKNKTKNRKLGNKLIMKLIWYRIVWRPLLKFVSC
ncbi:MAG: glycosyltransferase [Paraprevotella sp.]|nr:glycosyltransferase [Paraprevotella sp.]